MNDDVSMKVSGLTWEQTKTLSDRRCCDCGGFILRPGPSGGASQNMECVGCGSRFNIGYAPRAFCQAIGVTQPYVVFVERIPSEADGGGAWREDMFPRVLQ